MADRVERANRLVDELRSVSNKIRKNARLYGDGGTGGSGEERVYFPPKEGDERQPIRLQGYVSVEDVADLLYYIADLLEV